MEVYGAGYYGDVDYSARKYPNMDNTEETHKSLLIEILQNIISAIDLGNEVI